MNFFVGQGLDAPMLAIATTLHFAGAALRNHRRAGGSPVSSLAVVSAFLAVAPWLFPSAGAVLATFALHAAWFAVCERWGVALPQSGSSGVPRVQPPSAGATAAPRPGVSARPNSAAKGGSKGFVSAPVLSALDETRDIRTLRLARPEGFEFQPGQFLTVRVRSDGRELVRCYSISSPPEASGYLEISVKKQGAVSGALHACAKPGSSLTVRAPAGGFVYPSGDDRPLVLLAGGIGITPMMSMLRHAVLTEPTRPVTLLYSARTEDDFAFRDELESMARRSPRVRVTLAASRGATSSPVYPGRLDRSLLDTVPDLRDSIACLCGPQAMIDGLSTTLELLGMPRPQIRSELFEAAVAGSARWRQEREGSGSRGGVAVATTTCRMKAARSGREVEVVPGQTLLDAADAHGLSIPSLCRAGVCGTCRTRVVAGEVECSSDLIDAQDRQAGYVLACVATPRTDCTVEV
jgi:ferredoxin-NADP reductase